MNRRIFIAVVIIVLIALTACSSTKVNTPVNENTKTFTGVTTKVAILPLKALDSPSRYIQKILTVRDLGIAFNSHPQYDLINLEETEKQFKNAGYRDVDALEVTELKEMSTILNSDVVIVANISESRPGIYNISTRFYGTRSNELRQYSFNVTKSRDDRIKTLETTFLVELDRFVSNEIDKIYNIAVNSYTTEKYDAAENSLKLVIGLNPEKADAYYYLGATYLKTKKYDLAEQNLEKAMAMNPTDQRASLALIDLYDATGNNAKKLVLMESIAVTANDEQLWLAIGNLHDESGNKNQAKAAFRKALEIDKDYIQAIIRLGFMLYEESDFNGAIPLLEQAAEQLPDNELVSDRLAAAYFRSNRISEAIARYEGQVKADPQNIQALLSVAGLYRMQASETRDAKLANDLNTKAINALNQVKKIDPENALVYLNLAAIYVAQKKNNDAETNANLAIAKNPSLYQPYVILASVNQTKGTEQYNRFADLEVQVSKAVGNKANQLKKDRDAAKASALNFFRRAKEQLESGRSRTSDASAVADINSKISSLNNLISKLQ